MYIEQCRDLYEPVFRQRVFIIFLLSTVSMRMLKPDSIIEAVANINYVSRGKASSCRKSQSEHWTMTNSNATVFVLNRCTGAGPFNLLYNFM